MGRDQAHYLFGVMRRGPGDNVLLFDGHNGEWLAEVSEAGKRSGSLLVRNQTAPQHNPPDLWLLFAPIKKARTDFIVEKAAEMGARRILPVQTDYTNAERIRQDRLQAHAVEAAEQCGGTFVPPVEKLQKLDTLLSQWIAPRQLMFCDEALSLPGPNTKAPFNAPQSAPGPWAILIGPEGGFSKRERQMIQALSYAHPVSLGPRVLRADTAAVAALTLWQSTLGDWI